MPGLFQSVPAWFDSSTSRASDWTQSLINPQAQPPSNLFQTRATHTPGGVAPLPGGVGAQYAPQTNPIDMIAAQHNLTPEQKATLTQAWAPQGHGFITSTPEKVQSPSTMGHEQFHALYQAAGLGQRAPQIAPLVSPDIVGMLHSTPVYQEEMRQSGVTPIEAEEGAANELFTYGRQNPQLTEYINRALVSSPKYQKQFKQLTKK